MTAELVQRFVRVAFERRASCGLACSGMYGHDPDVHERAGYSRALVERAELVDPLIVIGPLCIDHERAAVYVGGRRCRVTPTEFRALSLLARRAGRIVRHAELVAGIWDLDELAFRVGLAYHRERWNHLRTVINRLRANLGPEAAALIESVKYFGYRLRAPEED